MVPMPSKGLNRRKVLSTIAGSALASPFLLSGADGSSSGKKGWAGGDTKLHKLFRASWYYTWSPKTRPSRACEFVPMMKGAWSLKQAPAVQQMKVISNLLGFNEPSQEKQKREIDFVAIHWYGGRNADAFEKFADDFDKPIWVTEFNGWDGPEPENYEFLKKSLKFMERSREVERYAYFNKKKGTPLSLLKANGSPSRMGELYRDA